MEEQVLVKSYSPKTGKLILVLTIIGIILSALIFTGRFLNNRQTYKEYQEVYQEHQEADSCGWLYDSWETCYRCKAAKKYSSALTMTLAETTVWAPVVGLPLLGLLIKLLMSSFRLTVTDKRIYCKSLWIFHVCLPVDCITSVARIGLLGVVAVTVPSGRIAVALVPNAKEIYNVINGLLLQRQQSPQLL